MQVSRGSSTLRACEGTLAALALLAVGGCSDPDAAAYTEVVDRLLTVDRPVGWTTDMAVEAPWTKGFQPAPQSVEQMQVSGDFGEYVTASQATGTLVAQAQIGLAGFEVVQSRDVTIKGATTGQATRYTMTDNTGSQLSGEWIVAAHWPYPQSVAISILDHQFDPELERRVLESMELRPVLK
jgi:hypothetical protein